jgi:protein-disulfide isomerase
LNRRCYQLIAQTSLLLASALLFLLFQGCKKTDEPATQRTPQQQDQQPRAQLPVQTPPAQQAAVSVQNTSAPAPAKKTTKTVPATSSRAPALQAAPATTNSDIDPHKSFGSKNAPVVMEVFSDFQCPACKTLYITTNRPIMDNYVSTGKVYLVHRDFPLAMHAYSRIAARYARAAAQLGKNESVEQALFQNQEKWEQTGDVDGTVAAALSPAEMVKVRALVKSGTLDASIDKDFALGQMYRINQTPTTVFHSAGQTYPYAGVMSYDILKQFLDQLLSGH